MITASARLAHVPLNQQANLPWQQQLRLAVRSVDQLLGELQLSAADFAGTPIIDADFPLLVPRAYLQRMQPGNPSDPLLLQVLPAAAERLERAGYDHDPVGDGAAQLVPGLLQKYAGRALLVTTGACAIHCRYCFRRHYPYADSAAGRADWSAAVAAIAADSTITEVLLSGGDPLSMSTAKLKRLTDQLADVPHVRRLRLHTRWPVVLPARVDDELLDWLASLPWPVTVVIHANHAQELGPRVADACTQLRRAGVSLLNQSVLLAAINDSAEALCALSETLHDCGVLPYYLHILDPVAGAAHFDVPLATAVELIGSMRSRLPGYLVPRLAREIPGEASKQVLA